MCVNVCFGGGVGQARQLSEGRRQKKQQTCSHLAFLLFCCFVSPFLNLSHFICFFLLFAPPDPDLPPHPGSVIMFHSLSIHSTSAPLLPENFEKFI